MAEAVQTEKAATYESNQKNIAMSKVEDLESGSGEYGGVESGSVEEIARAHKIQHSNGVLRKMRQGEEWLDAKMGVETQGIDRVPDDQKKPPSLWNAFLLWWSLNIHVGVVPLGILGPEFGLTLNQTIAAAVIGNLLGAACTAFTGTLSPKLGLRQIATSRYSFGFYGAKLCSVLNIVIGGGYATVNTVAAGQILSAVSDYKMNIVVGIIIVVVIAYIVSLFGFRVIHIFEKYSWIVTFVLLLILIGQAAPHVDPSAPGSVSGMEYYGAFLSILAINFSNSSGWCSMAGDYYINYKASTPSWKIFALTYWGVFIPTMFSVIIGACIGNAALQAGYAPYATAYEDHQFGGLLLAIYHPMGWSKFCLVLLTFSILGNNVAVNYSIGLSAQLLGHYFHAVPRLVWSLLATIVIAVLAIAGKDSLSAVITDFVSMLGYWTVSFTFILLIEDKWFRRNIGYNLFVWDRPDKLPIGAAAVFSLLSGYLAGGVPGMAQVWFVGPLAAYFGKFGGDVGIYMSGAITLVLYPILRTLELKYFQR